jgi:eukaryotic-like serine/threonine-protein kinase
VLPPGGPVPGRTPPGGPAGPPYLPPGRTPPGGPVPGRTPPAGPAGPPHQPYQPKPRRRRWYRRKRVLIPLGLLVLLALLPDDQGTPPVPPDPSGSGSQLGRPVRDGELEFVVREVRCGVHRLGTGPLARDPQGQFCLARVEVSNVKTSARTLTEFAQKAHDSDGREHTADFAARFHFPGQTLWDQVNPGNTVRGTMAFDVPAGARLVDLELHDSPLSRGVTVRLP